MLTARGFALNAFRCGFYEGQDVLSDVDDVDLISLRPKPYYPIRQPLQKFLVWHDYSKKAVSVNMAFEPVKLTREYELFIAYFPHIQDLIQLSAVKGWKKHCKKSICWIDEVYAADVPAYKTWLSVLKDFDHVAIGMSGTVNAFSSEYKRPCHFVPGAVDTLRFSAYPEPPARVIDIYSIGRIGENLHHALLDMAARKGMFYVSCIVLHRLRSQAASTAARQYGQAESLFSCCAGKNECAGRNQRPDRDRIPIL
jgi:hypothetical protein